MPCVRIGPFIARGEQSAFQVGFAPVYVCKRDGGWFADAKDWHPLSPDPRDDDDLRGWLRAEGIYANAFRTRRALIANLEVAYAARRADGEEIPQTEDQKVWAAYQAGRISFDAARAATRH